MQPSSPPPEIPPDDVQPRRQLRPRTMAQTKPYTYDQIRYKRQIGNIPGAYEPMPETQRRRRSPVPGTFDEKENMSDPDVTPMDLDEEVSESERRNRRRRKSGSPDADEQHHRQRSRTLEPARANGTAGPSRRILKSPQKGKSPQRSEIEYPPGLQSMSESSSDEDNLIALARSASKKKSLVVKPPRRKRIKPFPVKQTPPKERVCMRYGLKRDIILI